MHEEQFSSLSLVIGSVGSPQFIPRLMDAVCRFVQLDHLAIDAVRGANRQKVSVGVSVTNSAFDKAVANSGGGRLAAAAAPQRSGASRKPMARRLNFDLLDISSRELEFYRRFG